MDLINNQSDATIDVGYILRANYYNSKICIVI